MRYPAPDAPPVPGEEQPEEAALEAEEDADKELDLELQSDELGSGKRLRPREGLDSRLNAHQIRKNEDHVTHGNDLRC